MTKGIVSRSTSSPSETVHVHLLCRVFDLIFLFQTLFVTGLTVAHTVTAADDGCRVCADAMHRFHKALCKFYSRFSSFLVF